MRSKTLWLALGILGVALALVGWAWQAVPRLGHSWVVWVNSWVVWKDLDNLVEALFNFVAGDWPGFTGVAMRLGIVVSGLVGLLMLLVLLMVHAGQSESRNEYRSPRYPRGRSRSRKADASRE